MLEIGAMTGQAAFRTNGPIHAVFLLTAVRPHRWCISSQRTFRAFHYHGQPFGTKRPIILTNGTALYRPIRPTDEIYNAKVGGASSLQKVKEISPTKNCFLPLSFISAF